MMHVKRGIFLLMLVLSAGCSTLNNPTVLSGLVGFAGCSVIGAATAPSDEKPEMHGLLWGTSCSTLGMLATELLTSENNKNSKKLSLQKMRSEDSLEELKIKNSILNSKGYEDLDFVTKEKLKGDWTIYKIDNWILDRGKIKHEDMEIEFQ